ncbi:hypothetical protein [Arthrobacter sp. B1805]|nr:hypothetical protein [Arthrobacter sp. B1805]
MDPSAGRAFPPVSAARNKLRRFFPAITLLTPVLDRARSAKETFPP